MSAPLRVVPAPDSDVEVIARHVDWLRRTGATPITLRYRRGVLLRLARALPGPLLEATADDVDRWQWCGRQQQPGDHSPLLRCRIAGPRRSRHVARWCAPSSSCP